jgi:hypothetical protein
MRQPAIRKIGSAISTTTAPAIAGSRVGGAVRGSVQVGSV